MQRTIVFFTDSRLSGGTISCTARSILMRRRINDCEKSVLFFEKMNIKRRELPPLDNRIQKLMLVATACRE
jgi:hypothetical protein